jgi:serine/threonine protein kinase
MTEYVPGTSLRPLIKAKQLTPEDAVAIMRQVLAGLSFAHSRGLVHGDIKPENILIHERTAQAGYDVEGDVKVTDFGLGRATRAAATQSVAFSASLNSDAGRHLAGTLDYMAPEQRAGEKIDVRTDLYACGVVLFEMLTGERPAGTDLPSDLVPGLPLFLDKAFRGSYARLDKRFASADAFAQVLARGEAATASIPMPTGHGCPQCRHPVEPGDQFCMHCGTQLVPVVRRCPACDGYPDPANAVCNVCGFDMRRAVHPQRLEA